MQLPILRKPHRPPLRLASMLVSAVLLAPVCAAQSPAANRAEATALIRQAVDNRLTQDKTHQPERFVLHKWDERHDVTQEIIESPAGRCRSAHRHQRQAARCGGRAGRTHRLDLLNAHPESQEHRQKREQADDDRVTNLLRLLPDAFLYDYQDTVPCAVTVQPDIPLPGASQQASQQTRQQPAPEQRCYHMTLTPNPAWNPPNLEAKILRGMAGEIWLEASDDRLCRLNAHLIQDVDFGWGIVGRLNQGGTVSLEQTRIGEHDWELTRLKLNFTDKALMVKSLTYRMNEEFAHFAPVPAGTDYAQGDPAPRPRNPPNKKAPPIFPAMPLFEMHSQCRVQKLRTFHALPDLRARCGLK